MPGLYSGRATRTFVAETNAHGCRHVDREPLSPYAFLRLLRDTARLWSEGKAFVYAAALAFYTIFSIVPLLLFLITITGTMNNATAVEDQILNLVAREVGNVPADFVEEIVAEGQAPYGTKLATGLTLVFLVYGASTVFHQLQNSINAMFGLPERRENIRHGILYFVITRAFSAAIVMILGLFFILVLAANVVLTALPATPIEQFFADHIALRRMFFFVLVPTVSTLFLSLLYKYLSGGRVRWRDLLPGSVMTVLLIGVGNRIISLYLDRLFRISLYGASGTVILFLVWIYYISMIVLFGAKFIALYAERYGQPIAPKRRLMLSRSVL